MAEYIMQQILQAPYIQQDESTIKVMDGKKKSTHTGYMWVMGSVELKYVCFEYQKGRSREGPVKSFKDYKGHLQTDAYEVYDIIDKIYGDIQHFHCWAHGRRKFVEAISNDKPRSEYALSQIQALYDIKRKCRDANYNHVQRKEERQNAKPILDQFKEWMDKEALKVTPSSPIGKAIAYLVKRWGQFEQNIQKRHTVTSIDYPISDTSIAHIVHFHRVRSALNHPMYTL